MGATALTLHRARFANWHEMRELLSRELLTESVLLGVRQDFLIYKRYVAVRPTKMRREIGNTLVVGPTRSGKGLLATAQLLSWQHSVIVNDVKGELFHQAAGYRARLGPVYVLDPTGTGHRYDPLRTRKTEDELLSAASQLLYQPDEGEGRIFTERATVMLSQLFAAANLEGIPAFPYVRHVIRLGLPAAAFRLNTVSPELATQFLDARLQDVNFTDRFLLSAWGTLTVRMRPFLTETVVRCLTQADFHADRIMQSPVPVTVYLRWKEQDLLALSPLVRLLWGTLIDELITTFDETQGRGCHPVLLLIDEAGRTAIPQLSDQATTVVGRGIYLWIAVQSLSQLEVVYGRARAQVLRDNMENQIFYPPLDLATASHLEAKLGKQSAFAHSITERDGLDTSSGLSEQPVPLLTAQEIMQLPEDEILCFHRRLPPFQIKRMDWRRNPLFTRRHSLPVPALPRLPEIAQLPQERGRIYQFPRGYLDPDLQN